VCGRRGIRQGPLAGQTRACAASRGQVNGAAVNRVHPMVPARASMSIHSSTRSSSPAGAVAPAARRFVPPSTTACPNEPCAVPPQRSRHRSAPGNAAETQRGRDDKPTAPVTELSVGCTRIRVAIAGTPRPLLDEHRHALIGRHLSAPAEPGCVPAQVFMVSRPGDDPLELRNCDDEINPGTHTRSPGGRRAQVR